MPYRIDLEGDLEALFDRLVELGALDVEAVAPGTVAALMPDSVAAERLEAAMGVTPIGLSPAKGRDNDSVWRLAQRATRVGPLDIVPADADAGPDALRLTDSDAFGTGSHPTTLLCLEWLVENVAVAPPASMLDVGTGSGVLAFAALRLGVPQVMAVDVDDAALRAASENARLNNLAPRLQFVRGGPESVEGHWPLVVANVLAAPLIEMAPSLVRRVGHHGRLLLSGIPVSVQPDVHATYRRLGMHLVGARSRCGWSALEMRATW